MTLVYMEGFESVVDNPDLVSRGWNSQSSTTVSGKTAMTVPSRSGVAGRGLMLMGPYNTSAGTLSEPFLSATPGDFGMVNIGQTIHSLWQSGGFSLGVNATFNQVNQVQIGAGYTYQIIYDGAQYYWAIGLNQAGTWSLFYSTDLINWTQTSSTPAGTASNSKIMVVGSGPTATIIFFASALNLTSFYSTNMGASWTATVASGGNAQWYTIPNRSSTAPLISLSWITGSGNGVVLYYQTSITSTPVRIGALIVAPFVSTTAFVWAAGRYVNSVILAAAAITSVSAFIIPITQTNYWYWCLDSTDPTIAANWVKSPTSTLGQMNDITYFPVTGLWYAAGYGGIASSSQTGTLTVPQGPTGAWTTVVATGAEAVWSIATNGTVLVAVGQDPTTTTLGAIWTSTNGTTWTKANRFILSAAAPAAGNANAFTNVIWDGARFIITGGQNTNVIATSLDGVAWTGLYYPDYTEVVAQSQSLLGVYSGSVNGSGQYLTTGGSNPGLGTILGVGISVGAPSAGSRLLNLYSIQFNNGDQGGIATQNVSINPLNHYYEIIGTAVPGTANSFTMQMAVDGALVPGTIVIAMAGTADTGAAQTFFNLPRGGNFTVIDDIYVTNFTADAVGNVGQMGVINIVAQTPSSDVQDQFTLNQVAATHAAAVVGSLSNSEGGIWSSTVGAKDIYASSGVIPLNYRVQALQAEAYFSKFGTTGGNCSVGVVSGAVETDATPVSAPSATPVFATLLLELDPNTGQAWTTANAQASKVAVTKVS